MQSWFKKVLLVIGIPVGIFLLLILLWWFGSSAYSGWESYQWQKQTDAFQAALTKPYRQDTYGGRTPEETWALFLDALKKNNIELASKYFVVDKQTVERGYILDLASNNKINEWIAELSTLQYNNSEPQQDSQKKYFDYKYYNTEFRRYIWSPVVFILNPYTKVWKISVL